MIMKESTFTMNIKTCLTPLHPEFASCKVDSEIENIEVLFSDELIKWTFRFLEHWGNVTEELNVEFKKDTKPVV